MKYTDQEIVDHARSYVSHFDQQKGKRLVLVFIGLGCVAAVFLLIQMLTEMSEKTDLNPFQNVSFISGIAFGIMSVIFLGTGVIAFLRMFSLFHGKELEVHRLLVRWNDEKTGQQPQPPKSAISSG